MLKRCALIALSVFGFILTSCNKSDSGSASSSAPPGSGNAKSIRIVYIPKNTGNSYFNSSNEGFQQAAAELGATFETVAPATADATSQLPMIKAEIQRGVNVIAISPNSTDALNQVFKEVMGKGITLICVDSDITGNEQYRTAAVLPTNPEQVGRDQIELLGKLIDYKGKFAILSSTTDAPNQNEWIKWMKEALKDAKYKDMQLVEVVYGNDEPQKSSTECEALLTKYPDLRGIIAPTTVGVSACAQTVESAGKAAQIAVTGLGLPDQMRRFIQNGTVKAFSLWSPKDEGYCAAQLGIQIASGKIKPDPGKKFTAGTLGQREIGKLGVVITGPPVVFTKDNIDQYHF